MTSFLDLVSLLFYRFVPNCLQILNYIDFQRFSDCKFAQIADFFENGEKRDFYIYELAVLYLDSCNTTTIK